MNNIQKSFKNKAARSLRFANGTPDIMSLFGSPSQSAQLADTESVVDQANAGKLRALQDQADKLSSSSGLSDRQRAGALSSLKNSAAEMGGTLNVNMPIRGLSARQALATQMSDLHDQAAIADFNTNRTLRRNNAAFQDQSNALLFANGAVGIQPHTQNINKVSGPGTGISDDIPFEVKQGGRSLRAKIANGEGLSVLPERTMRDPQALAAIEDIIEGSNGAPVARGLRFADGGAFDPAEVQARAAQARKLNPTAMVAEPAATTTVAPKLDPIAPEMAAGEPGAARRGIGGLFDKAKSLAGKTVNGVKSLAPVAETAAEAAPKWYQPAGLAKLPVGALSKVAAPLAAADALISMNNGFAAQNNRDADNIDARGGFLASAAKDAAPWVSSVGMKMGSDAARVGNGLRNSLHNLAPSLVDEGTVNPNNGQREGLWSAITTRDGGKTAGNFHDDLMADSDKGAIVASATTPSAAPKSVPPPVAASEQAAAAQEANPNVQALRDAGVQGGGTLRGIRTIDTPNGQVFTGRDVNGRLNVTSGLDNSAAQNEALRAKEAARMTADLARQKDNFEQMAIESNLHSNNPADVRRGLMDLQVRQQNIAARQAQAANAIAARGQDLQLQGHQLDAGARMASLMNQNQQQNEERNLKWADDKYGKGDGKDAEKDKLRSEFLSKLRMTAADNNANVGQLSPADMRDFSQAFEMQKRTDPNAIEKFWANWISGHPYQEDYNPLRATELSGGEAGRPNIGGYAYNVAGSPVNVRSMANKSALYGTYDGPAARGLRSRQEQR